MALDKARMVTNFKNKMVAAFGSIDETNFNKFATALMESVVEEIQAHAVVSTSGQYLDGQYNGTTSEDVERTVSTTGTVN
jgi:flavodoxin